MEMKPLLKTNILTPRLLPPSKNGEHWLISVLGSLLIPFGVGVFWLLMFSMLLNIDFFSHMALNSKAEYLSKKQKNSKDIVVVKIDQQTVNKHGTEIDNRKQIFNLVDNILNQTEPKLIVLDFYFTKLLEEQLKYDQRYADKVVWASREVTIGDRTTETRFDDVFSSNSIPVERHKQPQNLYNWGHDYFGESPVMPGALTTIRLVKVVDNNKSVFPALGLVAYAKGEKSVNGVVLRSKIKQLAYDRSKSVDVIPDFLSPEALLEQEIMFNTPHLPSYFRSISAERILTGRYSKKNFKDKYVFIGSTWEVDKDHHLSANYTVGQILKRFVKFSNLVNTEGFSQQKGVPGLYFQATILENFLNPQFHFPRQPGLLFKVFHWLTIVLVCLVMTFILIPFARKMRVLALSAGPGLYFVLFSGLVFYHGIWVLRYAEYLLISLNVTVAMMPGYLLGVSLSAGYLLINLTENNVHEK